MAQRIIIRLLIFGCVAVLILPATVVHAQSENALDGDSLTWSLQHDVMAFVSYDFQTILSSHRLSYGHRDTLPALVFSDPPTAEQTRLIRTTYHDIADSLLLLEPELDRLYLQAYLSWLVVILGENVSNQRLLNADNHLNTRYGTSAHNILLRRRISHYYSSDFGSQSVLFAAGRGNLIGRPGNLFNSYLAISIALGLEAGRVGLEAAALYCPGGLQATGLKSDWRDHYGDEEVPEPSFEAILFDLKLSYRVYDRGKFGVHALAGIRWCNLSTDPPIRSVSPGELENRSTRNILLGFRIEYLLGEAAERFEESFLFGLIKTRGIHRIKFVPFAQVELARFDTNSDLAGAGSSLTLLFGFKLAIGGRTQRGNTNLNILIE